MPRNSSKKQARTKIAVPLFKERVAPFFGASSKILLVEMQKEIGIVQEVTWDVGGVGPMEIARRLVDLGVEKVICGGIQHQYKAWLVSRGVTVLDNQRGPARSLIQDLYHPTCKEEETDERLH